MAEIQKPSDEEQLRRQVLIDAGMKPLDADSYAHIYETRLHVADACRQALAFERAYHLPRRFGIFKEFREAMPLTERESSKILAASKIIGADFQGKKLTVEYLEKNKLNPRYSIQWNEVDRGEVDICFSAPYVLDDRGHIAVVAYVKLNGSNHYVVHSYYRSASAAVWRYCPDYWPYKKGKKFHHGKGYGEESCTLPFDVQKALAKIQDSPLHLDNPSLAFFGTCFPFSEDGTGPESPYYKEINKKGGRVEYDNFYHAKVDEKGATISKTAPEQMRFTHKEGSLEPDFGNCIMSFTVETNLYGKINVEVFPSMGDFGHIRYMFCTDTRGRSWIAAIEDDVANRNEGITSTGLRRSWKDGGDLTTPAFEYKSQAAGYGDKKLKRGRYIDMYKNYISKFPVIKEYLAAKQVKKTLRS